VVILFNQENFITNSSLTHVIGCSITTLIILTSLYLHKYPYAKTPHTGTGIGLKER